MNNKNNSFIKRFTDNIKRKFSSENSSKNIKENILNNKKKFSELIDKKIELEKKDFSQNYNIKNKSKIFGKSSSFADLIKRSRPDLVYLVRGKDKERLAWHYVLINKNKKEMFLAKSKTGSIDVKDYGKILYSGWGENPPKEIIDKVNKEFGV